MVGLTLTQQRAFAFAPKPPAALSFLSAGYVLCSILRSSERRRKVYHRLIVGMSLINLIQSACLFWGTWAIPSGYPFTIGAAGTEGTCSAQGFLIQLCFTAFCYYCFLGLFALLAVRADFDERAAVRYEPWFHGCAFVFPIGTAAYGLGRHYFNPAGPWCYVGTYPPGCDRSDAIACVYGEDIQGFRILLVVAVVFLYAFATGAMVAMCRTVRRKEREAEATGLVGKRRFLEQARRQRSRTAVRQAALYLAAFYAIYFFSIVSRIIQWSGGGAIHFPTLVVGIIFQSLQGFLNMVVYVRTRLSLRTLRKDVEFAEQQREPPPATVAAQFARRGLEKSKMARRFSTEAIARLSITSRTEELQFSIFDGAIDPSSPWAAFLDDEEEEEESDEEKEIGMAEKEVESVDEPSSSPNA